MPFYEYECLSCSHRFERYQRITDDPVHKCEQCDQKVRRVIHAPAIHFKGSGFYATEYGKSAHNHPSKAKEGKEGGEQTAASDGSESLSSSKSAPSSSGETPAKSASKDSSSSD